MRLLRSGALYLLCAFAVFAARVGLWVTTYQAVRRRLVRPCSADPQPHRARAVMNATRVVARMARLVPDASCLTQSIACQAVLSWRGIPSTIAMGVKKDDSGDVRWHAWLLWNDAVVLQGNESSLAGFKKILDLPTPVIAAP